MQPRWFCGDYSKTSVNPDLRQNWIKLVARSILKVFLNKKYLVYPDFVIRIFANSA